MENLVKIQYHRCGPNIKKYDYLETTLEQRNELENLINNCQDIFNDIEFNMIKSGCIRDEIGKDTRIREDIKESIYADGIALAPCQLKPEYRDRKICYCCHDKDFNETIINAFHEAYHFNDPFNFMDFIEHYEEIGDKLDVSGCLKLNIKKNLSEYYTDYKTARYLSNQSKFIEKILKKLNEHFYFLNQKAEIYEHVNRELGKMNINERFFDYIFHYKFKEGFFRVMAIRRGFRNIDEFQIIQDKWDKYISIVKQDDYVKPGLYETLAERLLNEPIESMEEKIWKEFHEFFTIYHDFNLSTIFARDN